MRLSVSPCKPVLAHFFSPPLFSSIPSPSLLTNVHDPDLWPGGFHGCLGAAFLILSALKISTGGGEWCRQPSASRLLPGRNKRLGRQREPAREQQRQQEETQPEPQQEPWPWTPQEPEPWQGQAPLQVPLSGTEAAPFAQSWPSTRAPSAPEAS